MIKINNYGITRLMNGLIVIEGLSRVGDRMLGFEKTYRSAISKVTYFLNRGW